MAKKLGVSRNGYYAWLSREPSRHEKEDRELLRLIIQILENNKGRYGSPRVWWYLEGGPETCRAAYAEMGKNNGFVAQPAVAGNLLNRDFTAA